ERYDLMNDLMSFGLHRAWKRFVSEIAAVRPGQMILDLAGGTGDLTRLMVPKVGAEGRVVLSDINDLMLARGRDRLIDNGVVDGVDYVLADAEKLPFRERSFHCVCIGFGLRNVTRKGDALRSIHAVLRPGGRLLILEFSRLQVPSLRALYDLYSFSILPWLGRVVTHDAASYRYLAESIRMHPDQDALRGMMEDAGFERCEYFNLTGGVVAVHRGYRL
ncbi:MAG: class I SAM-dependent methyltransferase, partial [Gammaproteobacteria bacterium]|nr:class I SAM-dependent methyltransferase [Gammaproteobacteria bacterium]